MKINVGKKNLINLIEQQINNLFSINQNEKKILTKHFNSSLARTKFCFSKSENKYFKKKKNIYFNIYNSDQYSIFLYFFSHEIFRFYKKKNNLSDKIYYLNKALNGLDLFYEVKMPKVFFPYHPVGSVIGRAKIGNHFSFSQNCTVGNNKGFYPTIGNNVQMLSGSKILGKCLVGNNVIFSANSYIKDMNIPSNTIVFGQFPNNKFKKINK